MVHQAVAHAVISSILLYLGQFPQCQPYGQLREKSFKFSPNDRLDNIDT